MMASFVSVECGLVRGWSPRAEALAGSTVDEVSLLSGGVLCQRSDFHLAWTSTGGYTTERCLSLTKNSDGNQVSEFR